MPDTSSSSHTEVTPPFPTSQFDEQAVRWEVLSLHALLDGAQRLWIARVRGGLNPAQLRFTGTVTVPGGRWDETIRDLYLRVIAEAQHGRWSAESWEGLGCPSVLTITRVP